MSESDSFISEVAEEVRRERLTRILRRYGWLLALAVLGIVGGAAWHEWSKSQRRIAAEASGEALRSALALPDAAARAEALAALADGATPIHRIAEAGARLEAGDTAGAGDLLELVASDPEAPPLYRSVASLQRVMVLGARLPQAERAATLDGLIAPDGPMRLMALEQRALLRIESGDASGARTDLDAILADAAAPQGLRNRAEQLIVATGGAAAPAPTEPSDG